MSFLKRVFRRVKALLTAGRLEQEINDEFRLHLDLLQEEYQRSGMPPADAQPPHGGVRQCFQYRGKGSRHSRRGLLRVSLCGGPSASPRHFALRCE